MKFKMQLNTQIFQSINKTKWKNQVVDLIKYF